MTLEEAKRIHAAAAEFNRAHLAQLQARIAFDRTAFQVVRATDIEINPDWLRQLVVAGTAVEADELISAALEKAS